MKQLNSTEKNRNLIMSKYLPKILLVDDVPANLFALEHLLASCSAEIFKANSGNEALKLALQHSFSLILLDVQMPDMDGYETADLLLGDTFNKHVPIIFITAAYKDEIHRLKGYQTGAIDYIEKPVNDFILLSKVHVFLKLADQNQNLLIQYEKLAEQAKQKALLITELKKLRHAVEQSPVSVIITDKAGNIEFVNKAFEQITGYTQSECLGKNPKILQSGNTSYLIYKDLWQTLLQGNTWQGELHNKKKSDELFWEHVIISPVFGDDNKVTHYIAVKEDLTRRKEYENEILKQHNYDSVTSLPNRVLALDRLVQSLATAESSGSKTTIIFADIDNFKKINETYGRDFGNLVLIELAQRLTDNIRKNDTVACMGRDEFLFILPDLEKTMSVDSFCKQLIYCLQKPLVIDKKEIFVVLSLGITQSPDDGKEPHNLIQNAEAAMVKAKSETRNSYQYFTQQMNIESAFNSKMESRLRRALELELFQVYYQPLINCKTGKVQGAEALIRWTDEELGSVSPEDFIPFAENNGFIDAIGEWVLMTATSQAQYWKHKFKIPFIIAVNFSAHQFVNSDIKNRIESILKQTKLPYDSLEIEITERLLMQDQYDVLSRLKEIHSLGIHLSIDDFGTGYSSLSYLKRFPVSTVKIDKSFIDGICSDPEDAILTKTIISMAHSLSMNVIAEGVETEPQLMFLQKHHCDTIQGYFYSKPVDADTFEVFLKTTEEVTS